MSLDDLCHAVLAVPPGAADAVADAIRGMSMDANTADRNEEVESISRVISREADAFIPAGDGTWPADMGEVQGVQLPNQLRRAALNIVRHLQLRIAKHISTNDNDDTTRFVSSGSCEIMSCRTPAQRADVERFLYDCSVFRTVTWIEMIWSDSDAPVTRVDADTGERTASTLPWNSCLSWEIEWNSAPASKAVRERHVVTGAEKEEAE